MNADSEIKTEDLFREDTAEKEKSGTAKDAAANERETVTSQAEDEAAGTTEEVGNAETEEAAAQEAEAEESEAEEAEAAHYIRYLREQCVRYTAGAQEKIPRYESGDSHRLSARRGKTE